MRAPETAGVGTATVKMSFDAWKEGKVAPAEATLPVVAAPPGPPRKPVSPELRARLSKFGKTGAGIVHGLAFTADGRLLAAASHGTIKVWDAKTAREKLALAPDDFWVNGLALHPDGKTLVSGLSKSSFEKEAGKTARREKREGEVRLWDLGTGKVRATLKLTPGRGVVRMDLSPDGRTLAAEERWPEEDGKSRGEITLWDVEAGKRRATIAGEGFLAVAPDGKALAVCGDGVRLYDAATGKDIAVLPLPKDAGHVNSLSFSKDGRLLAGSDYKGNVHLWDVPKRTRRATWPFADGKGKTTRVAFAPDGRTLAVAVNEPMPRGATTVEDLAQPQIVLWDVAAGKARRTLTSPPGVIVSLAYSPDGRALASGSIGEALLWDVSALRAKKD